jgi:hypothetical protein
MKKLLLFWIFSGSLDSFSQDTLLQAPDGTHFIKHYQPKTDTLRAIILVTTYPNGVAHSRMGYVVIADGRKPVYLTCDKKALKLPYVGWGWVEAGEGRR